MYDDEDDYCDDALGTVDAEGPNQPPQATSYFPAPIPLCH